MFDLVVVSDLIRAQQTADGILKTVDPDRAIERRADKRLREASFGRFEGTNKRAEALSSKDPNDGIEPQPEVKARMVDCIADLIQEINDTHRAHTNVLLVSHGGAIRDMIASLDVPVTDGTDGTDSTGIPPNTSRSLLSLSWTTTTAEKHLYSALPKLDNFNASWTLMHDTSHLEQRPQYW